MALAARATLERKDKLVLRITAIIVAVLLLAGCGSAPASDTTGSQSSDATAVAESVPASPAANSPAVATTTSVSAETATTGSSEAATAPSGKEASGGQGQSLDLLASLTRSGGLLGQTETLLVRQDGTVALLNGEQPGSVFKTGQASPAQLQTLRALLESDAWQQLDPTIGRQVPDGFRYSVTGGGVQVTTYDGAQNPAVLESVLAELNELWQIVERGG